MRDKINTETYGADAKAAQGTTSSIKRKQTVSRHGWLKRYRALVLTAFIGLLLSVAAFFVVGHLETDRREADFNYLSESRCSNFKHEILNILDELAAVKQFYDGSQFVSRDEFTEFVSPEFDEHASIRGYVWAPRVADTDRSAFEQALQAEGYTNCLIHDSSTSGEIEIAARRKEYYPVQYHFPHLDWAIGLDQLSLSSRREAIKQARDMNQITVSNLAIVPFGQKGRFGVIAVAPVYKRGLPITTVKERRIAIEGVVNCIFQISDALNQAVEELTPAGIHIKVTDLTDPQDNRDLGRHLSRLNIENPDMLIPNADDKSGLIYTTSFQVTGQTWKIRCTASAGYLAAHILWTRWIVLLAGLVLTILIVLQLWLVRTRAALVEALVDERTAQLRESEERLLAICETAQDSIFIKNCDLKYTQVNPAMGRLFGHPAAEIVGCTDGELFGEEAAKHVREVDSRVLLGETVEEEHSTPVSGGNLKTFHVIKVPLRDSSGKIVALCGIARDITERKRAEEELQAQQQRLDYILRGTNIGTWEWNVQTGETTFNERWAEIIGYNLEEISTVSIDTWMKFAHPDDLKVSGELLEKHFKGELDYYECEARMRHKNGDWVWVLDRGKVATWTEDGKPLLMSGTHTDITKRKQAEEEMQKLAEVVKHSSELVNLATLDGQMIFLNQAGGRMLGIEPEEVKTTNIMEVIPDHLRDLVENEVVTALRMCKTWKGELQYRNIKTNEITDVHAMTFTVNDSSTGVPLYFANVSRDITDRKLAEEELRRYECIVSSSNDMLALLDKNFIYLAANERYLTAFGKTHSELVGATVSEIFGDTFFETVIRPNAEKCLQGHEVRYQDWFDFPDYGKLYMEITYDPYRGPDNEVVGFVVNGRDITEIKRLRELESRAQRLETAGQIAGQVAHDFNNLLSPLVAYPELIRDELPRDHPVLAYLGNMENSAAQMADISQQLLTLSRRGHYNQQPMNLNEVVLQVIKQMESPPNTLVCETKLDKNLMSVMGGSSQIHRLLMNLVVNARDAIQDIGWINIRSENHYVDKNAIAYGRVPRGEYVKITVSDTGCGIPDDIIQKIFDPFFTSKTTDKKRGSGLGLSVVDAVMKDHNGYLDISTRVGEGTSFYLYFPITRETVEGQESVQVVGGSEIVLVVDDDEIQREVSLNLLRKLGYNATAVESGEEAVEFLKNDRQDLLIIDMIMPNGIDGTETYRRALEVNPDQKAIIVSGFAESDRVQAALDMGAGGFVRKPLTRRTIASAVRRELDRGVEVAVL